jgi:hypothetical protein
LSGLAGATYHRPWGVEDPSQFEGAEDEKLREFARIANMLKRRIELLVSLQLPELDRLMPENKVRAIGRQ